MRKPAASSLPRGTAFAAVSERFLLLAPTEERMATTRKSGTGAKKSTGATRSRKTTGAKRSRKHGSGKRDTVNAPNATFYARRGPGGEFREMDEKGRSLAADRRKKAKARVGSGMGDRGDRQTKKR
jgi:hypothetical protein